MRIDPFERVPTQIELLQVLGERSRGKGVLVDLFQVEAAHFQTSDVEAVEDLGRDDSVTRVVELGRGDELDVVEFEVGRDRARRLRSASIGVFIISQGGARRIDQRSVHERRPVALERDQRVEVLVGLAGAGRLFANATAFEEFVQLAQLVRCRSAQSLLALHLVPIHSYAHHRP